MYAFSSRIVMKTNKITGAFTLVELLVVIAIIGGLMATLLPTLQMAGDKAKLIICGSNLRQGYISLNFYANDYNGLWPKTDYGRHTEQFYMLNNVFTNGPIYYLWAAGFLPKPEIFYCPAGPERFCDKSNPFRSNWILDSQNGWQPRPGSASAGYQYRMYFAFNFPGGVAARSMYSAFGGRSELRGYLKPDNHHNLAVWVDRFGSGTKHLIPNHCVSDSWNLLFSDGSARRRPDSVVRIKTSNFDWSQAGDYRIQKGANPNWPDTEVAHLWHWFDTGKWEYSAGAGFN